MKNMQICLNLHCLYLMALGDKKTLVNQLGRWYMYVDIASTKGFAVHQKEIEEVTS